MRTWRFPEHQWTLCSGGLLRELGAVYDGCTMHTYRKTLANFSKYTRSTVGRMSDDNKVDYEWTLRRVTLQSDEYGYRLKRY